MLLPITRYGAPCMSDSPTREEVKAMIEDAIEARVHRAVESGLDSWMSRYGLKPTHWVYLDAEYHKMLSRQGLVRRIVITMIVTAVCTMTLWGGKQWIQRTVLEYDQSQQVKK